MRLHQIRYAMKAHKESGAVGRAPTRSSRCRGSPRRRCTRSARGRANGFTRRLFNLVVTNVPGPQFPLYAAGARMLELYPVVPLARGQGLTIGADLVQRQASTTGSTPTATRCRTST